jgi:hypothetical protein
MPGRVQPRLRPDAGEACRRTAAPIRPAVIYGQ